MYFRHLARRIWPKRTLALSLITGLGAGIGISWQYQGMLKAETPAGPLRSTLPLQKLPVPQYATSIEFAQALEKITGVVGKEHVSTTKDILNGHSDTGWMYRHPKPGEGPQAVIFPKDAEEVSQIVKICHEFRVPVVPFSGGTSLEGQITAIYNGISIDLNRMSSIVAVHEKDLDVVVQPGVGWQDLAEVLNPLGLQFGPDPGPGAEIGGMVGTNASGTNSYALGTMHTNVLGVTVVLADGTIVKTRRRPRKSSAGYDLTDLFVGSEGTLGIVVEASLRVHPLPRFRKMGLLAFPDIRDAADMVQTVLRSGYKLDAIELVDDRTMHYLNTSGITDRQWDEAQTLLLKFGGPTQEYVDSLIEEIKRMSKQHKASSFIFPKTDDEEKELWTARKDVLFSVLSSSPPNYRTLGTDTAVPISQLSTYIKEAHSEIRKRGLIGCVVGHVGDGNFHCCMSYDPQKQFDEILGFANWTAERAIELDGTCTGEHGIGMGKRRLLLKELGEPTVDLMRQIKHALDPNFILNPGQIFSIQRVGDEADELPVAHCHCG